MQTLSRSDLALLGILAQNCRTSTTTIASAVRLSRDTVANRIRKLSEERVLSQFMLMIDARRLGFTRYHLLLHLDCGTEERMRYISRMAKHPFVMWINTFVGRFDLQLIVDARDSFHLDRIRAELFAACEQRIKHYMLLTHLSDLEFTNLLPATDLRIRFDREDDGSFGKFATCRNYPVEPEFHRVSYNRLDLELLNALADDPRLSITELAARCETDRVTARRHVIRLIEQKVIRSFAAITDGRRLGAVTYYLLVRMRQNTPRSVMQRPFRRLNNIFYAGHMLGDYDMILYLNARSPQELNSSIDSFRTELETQILQYDLLVQEGVHFWRHYTNGIHQSSLAEL